MTATLFQQVNYNLESLLNAIEMGDIGLPDIQRPFIWSNAKVRDLFDSMFHGYPVGYLLFWQSGAGTRGIGTDHKQKPPRLLIVDGQQRLTSLFAVVKGIEVIRENFDRERIQIAFNPREGRFEVADAAIKKDRAFLPDISEVWSKEKGLFKVVSGYLNRLQEVEEVSDDERERIQNAITRLNGLGAYPFTALELSADLGEEQVAEVFVRINSKGKALNQADFILTLMSVFWDEGRTALERFCAEARLPATGKPSAHNYFIEPSPDQLLRVSVALAFRRARLQAVYSVLRGKDLETDTFSEELRIAQFERLQDAQERVLNLLYWHDFLKSVLRAGFRNKRLISSGNTIIYSYSFYLVGRTDYKVPEKELRRVVSRWLYMASITGRYTSSPESKMEFDLARFRDVEDATGFVAVLDRICDDTLTEDFWTITLPNDLATSAAFGPSLFGYYAALNILNAKVLFSDMSVSELFDQAMDGPRKAIERHHLFPRGYLKSIGITGVRRTNQIANYALVEWHDNADIGDQAPSQYVAAFTEPISSEVLERMYYWHALPEIWQTMEYDVFLEARRERISCVMRDAFAVLSEGATKQGGSESVNLEELRRIGEGELVEFKSTLRMNLHTQQTDPRMELAVLRTIAGFLNGPKGGTLIIGIADDGMPVGIEADGFTNEDKMHLHLDNLIRGRIGGQFALYIHPRFEDFEGERVLVVECKPARSPVFVSNGNDHLFYIRTGASTSQLTGSDMQEYIKSRF
jgi:hypothetical protein